MISIIQSYHRVQFQGKRITQTQGNGEKPHFVPYLGLLGPNLGANFFYVNLVVSNFSKLSFYAI